MKLVVAMVVYVIYSCACMTCEHKPPNHHEATLPAACMLAITLGPQTATVHYADSDSDVAHLKELAEPHLPRLGLAMSAYVV